MALTLRGATPIGEMRAMRTFGVFLGLVAIACLSACGTPVGGADSGAMPEDSGSDSGMVDADSAMLDTDTGVVDVDSARVEERRTFMNAEDVRSGRLAGKTALITGAGSGIGMQAAELFAAEGANVVVADRDGDAARRCVASISSAGGSATVAIVDVSVATEVESAVANLSSKRAVSRLGVAFTVSFLAA